MIQQITGFRLLVGWRDFVYLCGDEFTEKRIVPGCLGNFYHIVCCGIMCFIRESVRIVEMCILTSELGCTLIHQFHKFLYRTAGFFCNGQSHFIGRFQHQSHQSLLNRKDFPGFCIDTGTSCFNAISGCLRHGNSIVHIKILTCQKSSHNLCNACRVKPVICVLGIKNGIRNSIHKNRRLSLNLRPFRPSFDQVSVSSLRISFGVSDSRSGSYDSSRICCISRCTLGQNQPCTENPCEESLPYNMKVFFQHLILPFYLFNLTFRFYSNSRK